MSRKKLILSALFGLVVLLLVIGIALWFGSGFAAASASAEKVYRDFEAEGIPLDSKAFAASLRIPDEENNAPEILKAIKALKEAISSAPKDVKDATIDYQPLDASAKVVSVEERKKAFSVLDFEIDRVTKSMDRPSFSIERNWDHPSEVVFDELGIFRQAKKLLLARALLRAEIRERDGAVSDLVAVSKISNFTGNTPTIIHGLSQVATVQLLVRGVIDCISGDPEGAARYMDAIKLVSIKPFPYFFRGEMYFLVGSSRQLKNQDIIAMIRDLEASPHGPSSPPYVKSGLGVESLVRASLANSMQKFLPVIQTTSPDGSFKDEQKYVELIKRLAREGENDRSWLGVLFKSVAPVFPQAHEATWLASARLDMARAVATVQDFKNKEGRYPTSLTEAGFDAKDRLAKAEKAYGLRISDQEIRVWSVGLNGIDEGGLDLFDPEEAKAAGMGPPTGFKDGDLVTRMKIR